MTKRALIVARVSTARQEDGYSPETQLAAMRAYAQRAGADDVTEILDIASGAVPIFERPGGAQIYEAIKARAVDFVVFYTIDRASRDEDVIDFIMLKRELRAAGVELHFVDTGKSEHDSVTGIIEYIRVSEAGRERKKITERTMRGKRGKAEAGQWVGGSHPPYGYRREGEQKTVRLVIDPAEAATVRRVFDWFVGATGEPLGIATIAAALSADGTPPPSRGTNNKAGQWYIGAVKAILKRRGYIGEFESYGQPVSLPDLAIIDAQTFNLAQDRLAGSRATAGQYERKYQYLLSGRIRGTCDKAMTAHAVQKGRYLYYECYWQQHERHMKKCDEAIIRADRADAVAWAWLSELLTDAAQLEEGLTHYGAQREADAQPLRERVAGLNLEIAEAERRIKVLAAEFAGEKDEFIAATLRTQQKQAAAQRAAAIAARSKVNAQLTRAELSEADKAQIRAWAAEVRAEWPELTFEKRRALLAMIDFQAQAEYRADVLGLAMTCGLKLGDDWRSLEKEGPLMGSPTFGQRRIVTFSTWRPLPAARPRSLADSLFQAAGVPVGAE